MSEKEYGTFGPAVDAESFFTNPVYYEDGIATVSSKEYSRYVSELMDRLGYSYEMIKYRQKMYFDCSKLANRFENVPYTQVTTGGKGEGTALFYESDIDYMYIIKDVICADNPQHFIHQEDITLFQTQRQETSPGYTRLKLLKFDETLYEEEIRASLFTDETGSNYLSSKVFTDKLLTLVTPGLSRLGFTPEPTSGPSTPACYKHVSHDRVFCFKCFCPDIIQRWVSRPRSQGWPTPETINEISRLEGHVVPIGFKASENMYREWRICYSLAELHLLQNLNEAQLKVNILLKKISKSVLNTIYNDITSYIMKNIILWISEIKGLRGFKQEHIMDRLLDCIQYLKKCVCSNNLPSYMIPERNLLPGKLDIQQKQQLTSVLGDLLQERGRMLLRCDKLRDAMIVMYKTPEMLREHSKKRDKVESLMLMESRIAEETLIPGMSAEDLERQLLQNDQFGDIVLHIGHLIQFDSQALKQIGKTHEEINDLWNTKLKQLLS